MKISYECEEIIKELKKDIAEFGDIEMYAIFKKIQGYTFLTDYNFIDPNREEEYLKEDLKEAEAIQIMKASKILEILEEQNEIL